MTAAIESLHRQYPGRFKTSVDTSCPAIFENNPRICNDTSGRVVEMHYPLINSADHMHVHFMEGYIRHLGEKLGLLLTLQVKRPYVYLSDEEKGWMNQVEETTGYKGRFWLVNAGYKNDYTVKKWTHKNWQAVVNKLRGRVQFVQVGEAHHNHKPLKGAINLIGKTDLRQLIRLAYHAAGILTPESFLHHLAAAFAKPCVTLASGFLPITWVRYHTGTILTRQHCMSCCPEGKGCWRGRVVKLNDGDGKDGSLCALPVIGPDAVALCMDMIAPAEVCAAVLAYNPTLF